MTHHSEDSRPLPITTHTPTSLDDLLTLVSAFSGVFLARLPVVTDATATAHLDGVDELLGLIAQRLAQGATLAVLGEPVDLVHLHTQVSTATRYQLWVAVRRQAALNAAVQTQLPDEYIGLTIYAKYDGQLRHTKTRLAYTYCPACNKTTKDYGGKKHTYHSYGTLMSDIWRDIAIDPAHDIQPVLDRMADLFGLPTYTELRVVDLSHLLATRHQPNPHLSDTAKLSEPPSNRLFNGDCLEELAKLPNNSIDFAFVDPPYNLKKVYQGYADDLDITRYFEWCDAWINELARTLRPGSTLALLNIPLWAIRHFLHMETVLAYQSWIVWDALSFPVRLIMPAHYTILCFSKGVARPLPGLSTAQPEDLRFPTDSPTFHPLQPLGEGYCLRANCVERRRYRKVNDRGPLTNIWWDIHRLKHNTRRVDHPCQLPPQLLYRLIALFTRPGEVVLDCFNGAGTTTLAAHQMGRHYIGIEREPKYYDMATERHTEINAGLDPFRKEDRVLTAKNSPVARLKKQRYEVPKKTLQLEVKRVAQLLGRLPNREEMIEHGQYPIRYYDEYFISWGEVCAAARTTGMTEDCAVAAAHLYSQKRLF